jgi:hypothetical protein
MTLRKTFLTGISAIALGMGAVLGSVAAQDAAPAAPPVEAPVAAAPAVDETKLESFAVAFLEVTKVTQTYKPQIEAAGTPEDQQRLQQEAGERMVEAVNDANGITLDEYNQIIQAAQTDPELAQRINSHISDAAKDQPAAQ